MTLEPNEWVFATLKLLEAPSILAAFRSRNDFPNKTQESKTIPTGIALASSSAEECAQLCLNATTEELCQSFVFCASSFNSSCYLMASRDISKWALPDNNDDFDEVICEAYDSKHY